MEFIMEIIGRTYQATTLIENGGIQAELFTLKYIIYGNTYAK